MDWKITNVSVLEDTIFQLKLKVARQIGVLRGMTVVEIGSGQGGFTAAIAKRVGEKGRVLAIDSTREYAEEFARRLDRYSVKKRVIFIQADGTNLKNIVSDGTADIVASYRLLEELKRPDYMPRIIREMARIVKDDGLVCLTEISAAARNEAEEAYIRLHKESGDYLFKPDEITETMKKCELEGISVNKVDTDVWFSPQLAKQDLGFAQVWFDPDVEGRLGSMIDAYGMKYPELLIFSGQKSARN